MAALQLVHNFWQATTQLTAQLKASALPQEGLSSTEPADPSAAPSDYQVPVPIPEGAEPAVRELAALAQRYGQTASHVSHPARLAVSDMPVSIMSLM